MEPVITAAINRAVSTYKSTLLSKDLAAITSPTEADDVFQLLRQSDDYKSTEGAHRLTMACRKAIGFSRGLDGFEEGASAFLWGSVKYVLTASKPTVDERRWLFEVAVRTAELLYPLHDSPVNCELARDVVETAYVQLLEFWVAAVKFYRRRRLWNAISPVWDSFRADYKALVESLERQRSKIEGMEVVLERANALQQKNGGNETVLEVRQERGNAKTTRWLSPIDNSPQYYLDNLNYSRKRRYPETCEWIQQRVEYTQWLDDSIETPRLLWIHAIPGAGKSVLAGYLVDDIPDIPTAVDKLFFFCDSRDNGRSSSVEVMRSLVYQLYSHLGGTVSEGKFAKKLSQCVKGSTEPTAKDFGVLQELFESYLEQPVGSCRSMVIVLDALDECTDPAPLIRAFRIFIQKYSHLKVVMTSRRTEAIVRTMDKFSKMDFEILPEDTSDDIASFLYGKVDKHHRLRDPQIKNIILEKLTSGSNGMFLWAALMINDLKTQTSIEGIKTTLENLPHGLEGAYIQTLGRLDRSLMPAPKELCTRVLRWVVCAFRPLRMEELEELLAAESKDLLVDSDAVFLYSKRDIELACGALVTIRRGFVHLTHLSTHEFLVKDPSQLGVDASISKYFVDLPSATGECSITCLQYISQETFAVPLNPVRFSKTNAKELREMHTTFEYCTTYWPHHFTESSCSSQLLTHLLDKIYKFAISKQALTWMEAVLAVAEKATSARALESVAYNLQNKLFDIKDSRNEEQVKKLLLWVSMIHRLLAQHFNVLCRWSNEIHFLDPNFVFLGLWETPTEETTPLRVSVLGGGELYQDEMGAEIKLGFQNWDKDDAHGVLHINNLGTIAFCIDLLAPTPTLECQNMKTGQRVMYKLEDGLVDCTLDPAVRYLNEPAFHYYHYKPISKRDMISAGFSDDSKKFFMVYTEESRPTMARLSVWSLDLATLFSISNKRNSLSCRKRFAGWLVDDKGGAFSLAFPGDQNYFPRLALFRDDEGVFISPFGTFSLETAMLRPWTSLPLGNPNVPIGHDPHGALSYFTSKTVFSGNGKRLCRYAMADGKGHIPQLWVFDVESGQRVWTVDLDGLDGKYISPHTLPPICGETGRIILLAAPLLKDGNEDFPLYFIDMEAKTVEWPLHQVEPKAPREGTPIRKRGSWFGKPVKRAQKVAKLGSPKDVVDNDSMHVVMWSCWSPQMRRQPAIHISRDERTVIMAAQLYHWHDANHLFKDVHFCGVLTVSLGGGDIRTYIQEKERVGNLYTGNTQVFATFYREEVGELCVVYRTGLEYRLDLKSMEWSTPTKESKTVKSGLLQGGDISRDGKKLAVVKDSGVKYQHEVEIYDLEQNVLLFKFVAEHEGEKAEYLYGGATFSANFRYCFLRGRLYILPLDLSSGSEARPLTTPKIAGEESQLGMNERGWNQFNEHLGLVCLGRPEPSRWFEQDYDPFAFSSGREVHIYKINGTSQGGDVEEIDTAGLAVPEFSPVDLTFHPNIPSLLIVMYERIVEPANNKEMICLYRIDQADALAFTLLRSYQPDGNDPYHMNLHAFPLSLDGQYIGTWFCAIMGFDVWRLDNSLDLPAGSQYSKNPQIISSVSSQSVLYNHTSPSGKQEPRLMLQQLNKDDGIFSLRRLMIESKEDAPDSHWRICDYWCYENCMLEGDGPFLCSLPTTMMENSIFTVLPIYHGDRFRVIVVPDSADKRPLVFDVKKTPGLVEYLMSGETPDMATEPGKLDTGEDKDGGEDESEGAEEDENEILVNVTNDSDGEGEGADAEDEGAFEKVEMEEVEEVVVKG